MTWVAAAVVGGAVVGGVASNMAAKKAANAQTSSSSSAIDYERESRDLSLGLQKPYRDASYAATAALMDLTGLPRGAAQSPLSFEDWSAQQPASITAPVQKKKKHGLFGGGIIGGLLAPTPGDMLKGGYDPAGAIYSAAKGHSDGTMANPALQAGYQKYVSDFNATLQLGNYAKYNFQEDPGYQFRYDEGNKALTNSLVSRGGALSGAGAKGALRYAQDYASNEYKNVYNRIATIAGFGQQATNASTNVIQNSGTNVGNAILNAGDARASSYIAQGNSWANTINQIGMAGGNYFGRPSSGSSPYAFPG